jgi:hypothetical protein
MCTMVIMLLLPTIENRDLRKQGIPLAFSSSASAYFFQQVFLAKKFLKQVFCSSRQMGNRLREYKTTLLH